MVDGVAHHHDFQGLLDNGDYFENYIVGDDQVVVHHPGTYGADAVVTVPYDYKATASDSSPTMGMAALDGNIFAATVTPGWLYQFDLSTNLMTKIGLVADGEVYSMLATVGKKLMIGIYSGQPILQFDPSHGQTTPWRLPEQCVPGGNPSCVPVPDSIPHGWRPFGLSENADSSGKIYFGARPDYGQEDGLIGYFETSGAVAHVSIPSPNFLKNLSATSVLSLKSFVGVNSPLLVGTSIHRGAGVKYIEGCTVPPAKVCYVPEKSQATIQAILGDSTNGPPFKLQSNGVYADTVVNLVDLGSGNFLGMANATAGGTLIFSGSISASGVTVARWNYINDLDIYPDQLGNTAKLSASGTVYAAYVNGAFTVNPIDLTVKRYACTLATGNPCTVSTGGVLLKGGYYLYAGPNLIRYEAP